MKRARQLLGMHLVGRWVATPSLAGDLVPTLTSLKLSSCEAKPPPPVPIPPLAGLLRIHRRRCAGIWRERPRN